MRKNLDKGRIIVPAARTANAGPPPGDNFHDLAPGELAVPGKESLLKKAKRKDMTRAINRFLVKLTRSPLHLYYRRCGRCGQVLRQEGDKLITHYCQCRHCLNCCAIRTAKMINAYLPQLRNLDDPYMITLTLPDSHVTDHNLRDTADAMIQSWRKIYKSVRRKWYEKEGIEVKGFRGLEVTGDWNKKLKQHKYHPHFHIIVDGYAIARDIQQKWLQLNPGATEINQRIVPADERSMKEILKYFTKFFDKKYRTVTTRKGKVKRVCYKKEINIHRLDVMLNSLDGLRLFNAFGIKKILEDKDEQIFDNLESQHYEELEAQVTQWFWQDVQSDWVDITTGECLSGNTRSEAEQEMCDSIRPCGDRKPRLNKRRKRRKVDRLEDLTKFDNYG